MTESTTKTRRNRSPMKNPTKAQYKAVVDYLTAELTALIAADDDVAVSRLKTVLEGAPDLTPVATVETVTEETEEAAQ
jgi:hypothetical protein